MSYFVYVKPPAPTATLAAGGTGAEDTATLTWTLADPFIGNVAGYTVQVRETPADSSAAWATGNENRVNLPDSVTVTSTAAGFALTEISNTRTYYTATDPAALADMTFDGLKMGTAYQARVRIANAEGYTANQGRDTIPAPVSSDWSANAGTTTGGTAVTVPDVPTSVTITEGNTQLTIGWGVPVDNGQTITGYKVRRKLATDSSYGAAVDVAGGAGARSFMVTGLTNHTVYDVQVAATSSDGTGDYATAVRGTPHNPSVVPPKLVPSLTAGGTTASEATLLWVPYTAGDLVNHHYRYRVELPLGQWLPSDAGTTVTGTTPDASADCTDAGLTGATATTCVQATITGLNPNITYEAQIRAENGAGLGAWSDITNLASQRTGGSATTPAKVADLAVTSPTQTSLALTWTPTSGADDNRVRWRLTDADGAGTGTAPGNWQGWVSDTAGTLTISDNNRGISTGSATGTYTITGLTAGTAYDVDVASVQNSQCCTWTDTPVEATTLSTEPGVPTGVTLSATEPLSLVVGWTAPTHIGSSAITGYTVRYRITADAGTYTEISVTGGATLSHTITELTAVAHDVSVAATNSEGTGIFSDDVVETPAEAPAASAPTVPLSVVVEEGDTALTITWAPPQSDGGEAITQYEVRYRLTTDTAYTEASVGDPTQRTFTTPATLTNDRAYDVEVAATNSVGVGAYSTAIQATPHDASLMPEKPAVALADGGTPASELTLLWLPYTAGNLTDHHYRYRVKAPLGQWQPTDSGGGTITGAAPSDTADCTTATLARTDCVQATITGLDAQIEYEVQMRVQNAVGHGEWSDIAAVTTHTTGGGKTTPTKVTDLTVTAASSTQTSLTLAWQPSAGINTTDNRVRWRLADKNSDGTLDDPGEWQGWVDATDVSDSPVLGDSDDGRSTGSVNGAYVLTGLTVGTTYDVDVASVRNSACCTWTDTPARGTTLTTEPGVPTSVALTATEHLALGVTWVAPVHAGTSALTGYTVRWRVSGSSVDHSEATVGADVLTHTITGLTAVAYEVSVAATNTQGTGIFSADRIATPVSFTETDGRPKKLTTAAVGGNAIQIGWTASLAPDLLDPSYRLRYRVSAPLGQWQPSADGLSTGVKGATRAAADCVTMFTTTAAADWPNGCVDERVDNPFAAATYQYQVRAVNDVGGGDWSDVADVTTTGSAVAAPGSVASLTVAAATRALELTWVAPSSGTVTEYRVRWRTAATTTPQAAAGAWQGWVEDATDISDSPDIGDDTSENGFSVGTALTHTLTGLDAGTAYDVSVGAFNEATANDAWIAAMEGTPTSASADDGTLNDLDINDGVSDLTLTKVSPAQGVAAEGFAPDHANYSAPAVAFGVAEVTITPDPAHPDATSVITQTSTTTPATTGNTPLDVGANTITITVTPSDNSAPNVYTIRVMRMTASMDVTLSNLTITVGNTALFKIGSGGDNTDGFVPTHREYRAMERANTVDELSINAIPTDENATLKIGKAGALEDATANTATAVALEVGPNTIRIEITAENGLVTGAYIIRVVRAEPPSAALTALRLSNGVPLLPNFAPDRGDYTASADANTDMITVTPTSKDSGATIAVSFVAADPQAQATAPQTLSSGDTSEPLALTEGDNTITIAVTSGNVDDGTTVMMDYTIVVNLAPQGGKAITTLENLASTAGMLTLTLAPDFAPAVQRYRVADVPYATESVTVTPTVTMDSNARVRVGDDPVADGEPSEAQMLNVGNNTIPIVVTAEDNKAMRRYTLAVRRTPPDFGVMVIGGDLAFDPALPNQEISVAPDATDLMFSGRFSDDTVTGRTTSATIGIKGENTDTLEKDGSETDPITLGDETTIIEIVYTQDNVMVTYTFTVVRRSLVTPTEQAEMVAQAVVSSVVLSGVLDAVSQNAFDAPAGGFTPFFDVNAPRTNTTRPLVPVAPLLLSEQPQGRDADWRELLGASAFRLGLNHGRAGDGEHAGEWSVWGAGDVRGFNSGGLNSDDEMGTSGMGYAGYLGTDYRKGNWLVGFAAGYSTTTSTIAMPEGEEDETSEFWLAGLYPYARYTWNNQIESWFLAGAGGGQLSLKNADASAYLISHLYALGFKAELLRFGNFSVAAKLDGAANFALSIDTTELEDFNTMQERLRLGFDMAYDINSRAHKLRPHLEVGARVDFGTDIVPGAEVAGGLRYEYAPARFSVDLRGRALVYDSIGILREWGAGATLRMTPSASGEGVAISLTPGWGLPQSRADEMWEDNLSLGEARTISNSATLRAELSYSFRHKDTLITPLTSYNITASNQTLGLGTRIKFAPLSLEVVGERVDIPFAADEYRLRLTSSLRF